MNSGYILSRSCYTYTKEDVERMREAAKEDGGLKKLAIAMGRKPIRLQQKANSLGIYEPTSAARMKRRADIKAGLIKAKP